MKPVNAVLLATALWLPAQATAQTLEETLDLALENSPVLNAARAREDGADAGVRQARAERNPSASAQGQIGVGRIDPRGFFGLPADKVVPRVAQVEAQWPLFTGGRVGAAVAQAQGGADVARLEAQAVALDVRLQVIAAYTQALSAQEQVRAYGAMVTSLREVTRQSRLMFKAGAVSSTAVSEAEARLAQAEAGLAGSQGTLATAKTRLDQLAGMPVQIVSDLPAPPPVPISADAAVMAAIADNPRLAQARRATEIAQAAVRGARAERLPTVAAYAEASSIRDQFFPGYKADSASVGVRGRWNFYTGGRAGAKISKAEAEARAASLDAVAAEDMLRVETVQRYETFQASSAVLAAAEKRAEATAQALRSTRLEVQAGAKPQSDLLDAEREAIDAERGRIEAAGNRLAAAYALRAVTGMDTPAR